MPRLFSASVLLAISLLSTSAARAQSVDVKIEPYTGPPIYLPKAGESVPATEVESSVKKEDYKNGKVWIERGLTRFSDNSFVSDGVYREFYPDGQQFVEGEYDHGEPIGQWTYWRPTGQIAKKVTYKNGQPDGLIELFRADGTLEARKNFAEGKRDGEWETFAEDGQTRLTHHEYRQGTPTGDWKWWYENGQLQRESSFVDGKMNGVAQEWAEDGAKRAEVEFKEGKRHGLSKQWTPDGREVQQQYENGVPVSTHK